VYSITRRQFVAGVTAATVALPAALAAAAPLDPLTMTIGPRWYLRADWPQAARSYRFAFESLWHFDNITHRVPLLRHVDNGASYLLDLDDALHTYVQELQPRGTLIDRTEDDDSMLARVALTIATHLRDLIA
jgi:hypothetical protein